MKYFVSSYEIGARELLPRIALALNLAQKNISSIIGHKFAVKRLLDAQAGRLSGCFTHKDGNADASKYYASAKRLGLTTLATDEEYLNWAIIEDAGQFVTRVNSQVIDYFFCSTTTTLGVVEALGFRGILAGNLRLGLSEIFANSAETHSRSGKPRVLINSPTGTLFSINPLISHLEITCRLSESKKKWSETLPWFWKVMDEERSIIDNLLATTKSAQRHCDVIIRSHPAEASAFFQVLSRELGAQHDPAIHSSIMAAARADVVLAYDCTTLLEAFYLRKAFINLARAGSNGRTEGTFAARFLRISAGLTDLLETGSIPRIDWEALQPLEAHLGGGAILERWAGLIQSLIGAQDGALIDLECVPDEPIAMHPDIERRRGTIHKPDVIEVLNAVRLKFGPVIASISIRNDGLVVVCPSVS